MPVNNRSGKRIAVIQVINKRGDRIFSDDDENILKSLASQMAIAIENAQLIDELKLSFESSIRTLSATVDARHHLTAGHSERVTEYSLMIARSLGLGPEEWELIKYAGLLHDIGKIGTKDAVLLKSGRLTKAERMEMQKHAAKTKEILDNFHFSKELARYLSLLLIIMNISTGRAIPINSRGRIFPCAPVFSQWQMFLTP